MYIGVCYKSLTVTEEEEKDLFSLIQEVSIHQVIIMGDFNYPSISWESFEADNKDVKFLDLVQVFSYISMCINLSEEEIY